MKKNKQENPINANESLSSGVIRNAGFLWFFFLQKKELWQPQFFFDIIYFKKMKYSTKMTKKKYIIGLISLVRPFTIIVIG